MNPSSIGEPPEPQSAAKLEPVPEEKRPEEPQQKSESEEVDEDDKESQMNAEQVTKLSNETTLLRQDFMLEPDITVHEFLRQYDATIVDFVRLERGAISAVHNKPV